MSAKINAKRWIEMRFAVTAILGFSMLNAAAQPPSEAADLVVVNGQILTVDENFSIAEAMAVKDGRLQVVGSNELALSLADAATDRIDLGGRTVVPGLIDNHMHFVRAGRDWYRHVRWDDVTSRKAALAALADRSAQLPSGEWLLVIGGWNFEQFEDDPRLFTRAELDAAIPNRPLYIQEGYRRAFANSRALAAAGVDNGADPRSAARGSASDAISSSAELTGSAMALVAGAIPVPDAATASESLRSAIAAMHAMGLTSVYDVAGNSVTPSHYDAVRSLAESNRLSMRVFYSLNEQHGVGQSAEEIINALTSRKPDMQGLRFAQFGWGEATYAPMRATPWHISNEDLQKYESIALAAAENGWQMHEHSMREVKIAAMLDVFEAVDRRHSISDLRWIIAHTNGMSAESIKRANALGLVFAVHSSSRLRTADEYANGSNPTPPIRDIDASGGIWGLGSDGTTVASPNPFHNIGWAVSGLSPTGERILDQTVSRVAALTAHTRTNAYLLFREQHLGSLEPGKLADFVVLDGDYMTVPESEIKNLRPVMTFVGGDLVYSAEPGTGN